VAIVGDDPLGQVFNVRAFHRDQVLGLIKKELIPTTNPKDNKQDVEDDQPKKKKKKPLVDKE